MVHGDDKLRATKRAFESERKTLHSFRSLPAASPRTKLQASKGLLSQLTSRKHSDLSSKKIQTNFQFKAME